MNAIKTLVSSLLLCFALAGSALAVDKVNVNTADSATIDRVLVNIGPAKANAIVAYRKANGAFRNGDDLAKVKGVGAKTVEKNRDRLDFGGSAAPARKATASASTAKPAAKR